MFSSLPTFKNDSHCYSNWLLCLLYMTIHSDLKNNTWWVTGTYNSLIFSMWNHFNLQYIKYGWPKDSNITEEMKDPCHFWVVILLQWCGIGIIFIANFLNIEKQDHYTDINVVEKDNKVGNIKYVQVCI